MSRGLPYSILVHVLALVLLVLYGNFVPSQPIRTTRAIPFRLLHGLPEAAADRARLPAQTPQEAPARTPPEARPEQPEPAAPDLPAKEVPKAKPQEPPKKKPAEPPRTQAATGPDAGRSASSSVGLGGPSVGGTDSDFPFAWYLTQVEGMIAANWNPSQLGFRDRAVVTCSVHFTIARNGTVSGVRLSTTSGVGVYDRLALGAVQTTRLPPLPPQYRASSLGVTFIFNLEPGS